MAISQTFSPVDGSLITERELASGAAIDKVLQTAQRAQKSWRETGLSERITICEKFVTVFESKVEQLAEELTWAMGRPLSQTPGEIKGVAERACTMIDLAYNALSPIELANKQSTHRYIERVPLGVVFLVAPWNFPYLTAVNTLIPALLAGNAVIIKHSAQTPLCAERFVECLLEAGLPEGVCQFIHTSHENVAKMIQTPVIDFVAFTGSVEGGHAVARAASERFIACGLELGGKDPAYIREDADLKYSVSQIVDGAFFNSGQSCCGIERIYVHESVFSEVVEQTVDLVRHYQLGNPLDHKTTLGPVVRASAAGMIRSQIAEAVRQGARALIPEAIFDAGVLGPCYLPPQVLIDVTHDMQIMTEETFGPVVCLMPVSSDAEAIALMNDSDFGLTASIWTQDEADAVRIGQALETGTVFMNRCDYLDPELAWVGVKNSGRGCTLSRVGFEQLTRPKSFNFCV